MISLQPLGIWGGAGSPYISQRPPSLHAQPTAVRNTNLGHTGDIGTGDSRQNEAFWHDDGSVLDPLVHQPGALPFAVLERFPDAARNARRPPIGS
jgi:hypothetical protein